MKNFVTKYQKYLTKRNTLFLSGATLLLLVGLPVAVLFNSQQQNLQSNAAGTASIEAENGTVAGNVTVVTDTNAAGGQYVKFGVVQASGPVLYVASTGLDNNTCTQSAPCKTFARADVLATPGTTVHVAPGAYTGPIILQKAGTSAARVRWVSDSRWGGQRSAAVKLFLRVIIVILKVLISVVQDQAPTASLRLLAIIAVLLTIMCMI